MATITAKEQAIWLDSIKTEGMSTLISMRQSVDYAPLLKDKAFMKKAVKLNKDAIKYADITVVREFVRTDGMLLENASIEARADKAAVYNAVSNKGKAIEFADKQFLSNEEVAFEAVKNDWRMLGVVDKKFRGRLDFAEASLDQDKAAKDLVNPTLFRNNKTAALRVIDKMDISLSEFSRGMRKDFNTERGFSIVGKMVEKDAKNIRYAIGLDNRTECKRIAEVAVTKDPSLYKYLPKVLKQDEDIAIIVVERGIKDVRKLGPVAYSKKVALAAVQHNGLVLAQYKRSSVARNYDIVKAALLQNGEAFQHAHVSLRKDRDLLLLAVSNISKTTSQKDNPLSFAPQKYRKDIEIMMASVKHDPLSLAFARGKAEHSHDIILEAVKGNGLAIQCVPKKERNNKDIAIEALSSNEKAVKYISKKFLEDDKNKSGLITVLKKQPKLYEKFTQSIQNDPQAILFASEIYPEAAKNLPREYAQNKEYMKQLAARSPKAFEAGISIKLSLDDKFMAEAKIIMEDKGAREKQNKETEIYSFARDEHGNIVAMLHKVIEEKKPKEAKKEDAQKEVTGAVKETAEPAKETVEPAKEKTTENKKSSPSRGTYKLTNNEGISLEVK